MIRMIAATAVLCGVIAFVCWAGAHLETSVYEMAEELEAALGSAGLADWEAISENLTAMENRWAEIRPFAQIILEQCVVQDADEALARLSAAAAVRDSGNFLTEAASLEACLTGLVRGEDLSWNTVL